MKVKVLFALTAIGLASQAAVAANPLTWIELKALAEKQNPSLAGAAMSQASARMGVKAAYGEFLPEIGLSARRSGSETKVSVLESNDRNRLYTVAASWNLFQGFATVASLRRARALARESSASRDLVSSSLRYDLRKAFFRVYTQQERIRLFEKIAKRQQQNEKLISLKYDSGSEARWNVLKTKADRERAEYNLAAARLEYAAARDQLAYLVQMESLPDVPVEAPHLPAIPEIAAAETARLHPELRQKESIEQRLAQDQTLSRSAFFPSLDLSYTRSRDQMKTGARNRTETESWAITAQWNIFNGLSDYHKVQQANLALEAAELEKAGLERRLVAGIRSAAASLRAAVERVPSAKSLREAAEERVRTVSAQYRAGLKTYLDWEQAETQLTETEQAEVSAVSAALDSLAEFERAVGATLEQP